MRQTSIDSPACSLLYSRLPAHLSLQRLWFKTNLKLGNLLYEIGDYARLSKIIKELLLSCEDENCDDGVKKNTQVEYLQQVRYVAPHVQLQLLEVYALQIQMYTSQKDNKNLMSMYEKALRTKSGVAHPVAPNHIELKHMGLMFCDCFQRIIGVIRECGGKMHMMQVYS